jgi:hypothetical protein
MKRKPILFEKLFAAQRSMGREVIGLIGTHHGAGVTHTGLMLAFYLGMELGRKTAFLECNSHHDMNYIQKAYDWSREDDRSFSFHRITCYKEVKAGQIAGIFGEAYHCILMDFGVDFMHNKEEFYRCSTKIIVGGRSEWDIAKLLKFSDTAKEIQGSENWLYFIPLGNNKTITKLRNEINGKIWAVPQNDEPVIPSQDTSRFFRRLF